MTALCAIDQYWHDVLTAVPLVPFCHAIPLALNTVDIPTDYPEMIQTQQILHY